VTYDRWVARQEVGESLVGAACRGARALAWHAFHGASDAKEDP